jgi:hypothetical protein
VVILISLFKGRSALNYRLFIFVEIFIVANGLRAMVENNTRNKKGALRCILLTGLFTSKKWGD